MKYRENMTPEELEQFKAEVSSLEAAYAAAAAHDEANAEPESDEYEDPSKYTPGDDDAPAPY